MRAYLDAGGSAPLHPAAAEAMAAAQAEGWADPRRLHAEGRRAALLLDGAKQVFAEALGARPAEIRLLPSHAAGIHAAVTAIATARRRIGDRVVLSAVERAAVHGAARAAGAPAVVGVDDAGRVDPARWAEALTPGTALAALQHANGEVGTLQPVAAAHEVTRAAGVPLLVDAGASLGHVPIGPTWDALLADPADWGGPRGIGVLALRASVRTTWPGPQDAEPWEPGGVSVPGAIGAAAALRAVLADLAGSAARRRELIERIRVTAAAIPDVAVHGDADRLPHVLTFSCLYVTGEVLLAELDRRGFAVGSGSACSSATLEPSHVLAAMGALTQGNVRISLPHDVADDDVARLCAQLPDAVAAARSQTAAGVVPRASGEGAATSA